MPTGGLLFSDYFLRSGVEDLPEWQAQSAPALEEFRNRLTAILDGAADASSMNESETERFVLEPVLEILGWTARLRAIQSGRLNSRRCSINRLIQTDLSSLLHWRKRAISRLH